MHVHHAPASDSRSPPGEFPVLAFQAAARWRGPMHRLQPFRHGSDGPWPQAAEVQYLQSWASSILDPQPTCNLVGNAPFPSSPLTLPVSQSPCGGILRRYISQRAKPTVRSCQEPRVSLRIRLCIPAPAAPLVSLSPSLTSLSQPNPLVRFHRPLPPVPETGVSTTCLLLVPDSRSPVRL